MLLWCFCILVQAVGEESSSSTAEVAWTERAPWGDDYALGGANDAPEESPAVNSGVDEKKGCLWGWDAGSHYRHGEYADINGYVFVAREACTGVEPVVGVSAAGNRPCWAVVNTCVGESPMPLTEEEAVQLAASKDQERPVIVYSEWNARFPSRSEVRTREREALLSDPVIKELYNTVGVTLRVEDVENLDFEGDAASLPENVQRVQRLLTKNMYDRMFPVRNRDAYSYKNLLRAIALFPSFCRTYQDSRDSDEICKELLGTCLAHFAEETNADIGSLSRGDDLIEFVHRNVGAGEWYAPGQQIPREFQGLWFAQETLDDISLEPPDESKSPETTSEDKEQRYYRECETVKNPLVATFYPCLNADSAAESAAYVGRGPFKLRWNFNYGRFSEFLFNDATVLLKDPDLVSSSWLAFASALWFINTAHSSQPPVSWVVDGTWLVPREFGVSGGFGLTTNILTAAQECTSTMSTRVQTYVAFMAILGGHASSSSKPVHCVGMPSVVGSGFFTALQYWAPATDGSTACVPHADFTPFELIRSGAYAACVDYYFRSFVIYKGSVLLKNGQPI